MVNRCYVSNPLPTPPITTDPLPPSPIHPNHTAGLRIRRESIRVVPDAADERSLLEREEDEGAVYLKITSIKPILHEGETAVQVRRGWVVFVYGLRISIVYYRSTYLLPPPPLIHRPPATAAAAPAPGARGATRVGAARWAWTGFTTRCPSPRGYDGVESVCCVCCVHI